MSIKKSQAILKCFIDLRSSVWFTLGSEDETISFVTLWTLFSSTAGQGFHTLNDQQSYILRKMSQIKKIQLSVEAAWPSGQRVGLAIRRSRVRVPLWPLAGFVLGRPEFKFSAMLVNSQLVAFCQLGFLILF